MSINIFIINFLGMKYNLKISADKNDYKIPCENNLLKFIEAVYA